MSVQIIARRYAIALADVVAKHNVAAQVQPEISGWATMIKDNAGLREVLDNPTVPAEKKRTLLSTLIDRTKVGNLTANFLQVLMVNGRLTQLPAINEKFTQILDERAGLVTAHITTARPVAEAQQTELRARLAGLTGKQVSLQFKTDAELIGGLVTRIGSTIYDGSVRNQLEQVKEKMISNG